MSMCVHTHDCPVVETSSLSDCVGSEFPRSYGNNREESFMSLALRLEDERSCRGRAQRRNIPRKNHQHRRARRRTQPAGLRSTANIKVAANAGQPKVEVNKSEDRVLERRKQKKRPRLPIKQKNCPISRRSIGSGNDTDSRETEKDISSHNFETNSDETICQDLKPVFRCEPDVEANIMEETNKLVRKELQKVRAMVTRETNTMRDYFRIRRKMASKSLINLEAGVNGKDSSERDASTNCCGSDTGLTDKTNQSTFGSAIAHDNMSSSQTTTFSRNWNHEIFPCTKVCRNSSRNAAKKSQLASSCVRWEPDGRRKDKRVKEFDKSKFPDSNNAERQRTRLGASKEIVEIIPSTWPFHGGYSGQSFNSSVMCRGSKFDIFNVGPILPLASVPREKGCAGRASMTPRDTLGKWAVGRSPGDHTGSFPAGLDLGQKSLQRRIGCGSNEAKPLATMRFVKT